MTLLIIGVLLFLCYKNIKVTNIYVTGNNLLKEQEVIDLLDINNNSLLKDIATKKLEEKLLENKLIMEAKIDKSLLGKIVINIKENRVLYKNNKQEFVLESGNKIDRLIDSIMVPTLINDCEIEEKLISKMILIDKSILIRISEIKYEPTELDKEKFLLYMTDGNYVYITLNKIDLINSYNEIYPSLEGKKGVLHLDSGNHFEIKKE